jgi:hypothetical protein
MVTCWIFKKRSAHRPVCNTSLGGLSIVVGHLSIGQTHRQVLLQVSVLTAVYIGVTFGYLTFT